MWGHQVTVCNVKVRALLPKVVDGDDIVPHCRSCVSSFLHVVLVEREGEGGRGGGGSWLGMRKFEFEHNG